MSRHNVVNISDNVVQSNGTLSVTLKPVKRNIKKGSCLSMSMCGIKLSFGVRNSSLGRIFKDNLYTKTGCTSTSRLRFEIPQSLTVGIFVIITIETFLFRSLKMTKSQVHSDPDDYRTLSLVPWPCLGTPLNRQVISRVGDDTSFRSS